MVFIELTYETCCSSEIWNSKLFLSRASTFLPGDKIRSLPDIFGCDALHPPLYIPIFSFLFLMPIALVGFICTGVPRKAPMCRVRVSTTRLCLPYTFLVLPGTYVTVVMAPTGTAPGDDRTDIVRIAG